MSQCGNCGAKLSCGCQKRRASDGRDCCTSCVSRYEKTLKDKKPKASVEVHHQDVLGSNSSGYINSVSVTIGDIK
jgi:hypothetical protein